MKKLLSLLSVLTISGTAVPTTIAASSYQKEEQNLKNLNRVKRGNKTKKNKQKNKTTTDKDTNSPSTSTKTKNKKCGNRSGGARNQSCRRPNENNSDITTKSARERILNNIKSRSNNIFKSDRENEYNEFLRESIQYFKETKNIVHETTNPTTDKKIYRIKKHNVEDSYKVIPLEVEGNKIDLILNKSNLYVDGIITHNNGDGMDKKLFYFSDSNLAKNAKSLNSNDKYKLFGKILDLEIKTDDNLNILTKKLDFNSNYNTLAIGKSIKINKETIRGAITNLSNINDDKINEIKSNKKAEAEIKKDFLRVIFTTAEATRFFSIRQEVNKILTSSDSNPYEITWEDHNTTLKTWDKNSQKYYEMKNGKEFTDEEKSDIYNIAVLAVKDDEKIRDNQRG